MATERADYLRHSAQLAVRDRDTVADRRRAQPLALRQHRGQIPELDLLVLGGQRLCEFIQNVGLGSALQIGDDHVSAQDIGNFHLSVQIKIEIEMASANRGPPRNQISSLALKTSPVESDLTFLALN